MTTTRERPVDAPPDFDAEQEVDLGRYGSALATRWWLLLAGLVLGAIAGYLLSLGGNQTYRAQAVIYVGQPYSPTGANQIQSPQTNPSSVRQVVKAESNIRRVAAAVGLPSAKLRSRVSANPISGNLPKLGQVPLYAITVKGNKPVKIAHAANLLAQLAVHDLSAGYVETKIAALDAQVKADEHELADIDDRIAKLEASLGGVSAGERISTIALVGLAEQRRGIVLQDLLQSRPLLAQARTVERGRILTRAVASRATARSHRNSLLVGALIGLLLGGIAALLWEPVAARFARRTQRP
jgi:capsular polysaccharide biosynthesis protein